LRLRPLCMATPLLHKSRNHKSAVVGGVEAVEKPPFRAFI